MPNVQFTSHLSPFTYYLYPHKRLVTCSIFSQTFSPIVYLVASFLFRLFQVDVLFGLDWVSFVCCIYFGDNRYVEANSQATIIESLKLLSLIFCIKNLFFTMSLNQDSANSVFADPASDKVAPDGTGTSSHHLRPRPY